MTDQSPPAEREQVLHAVRDAGQRLHAARDDVAKARTVLSAAIRAAAEHGVPETVIAATAGVGRLTVRRDLGKPISRTPWPVPVTDVTDSTP